MELHQLIHVLQENSNNIPISLADLQLYVKGN